MGINWGRALMTGTSGALDSRRALEIAERLRIDADARDLASRQTLAGEAFGRQESLLDRSEDREDKRYARTEAANALSLSRRTVEGLKDEAIDLGIPPDPTWKARDYRNAIASKNAEVASAETAAAESGAALDRRAAELRIRKLEIDIANSNQDDSQPRADPRVKDAITARRKRIEMEIESSERRIRDISDDVKSRNDPDAQAELKELTEYMDVLLDKYESAWDDVMLEAYPPPPPPPSPGGGENPLASALASATADQRGATGTWD